MPHGQTGRRRACGTQAGCRQTEPASEPSRVPDWAIQQLAFVPGRYVNSRQRNHKAEKHREKERERERWEEQLERERGLWVSQKRRRQAPLLRISDWDIYEASGNNNRQIKIKERITEIKKSQNQKIICVPICIWNKHQNAAIKF